MTIGRKKCSTISETRNIGWAKSINEKLVEYNLETNWETIRSKTKGEWKRNKEKMIKSCCTETVNENQYQNKMDKPTTNNNSNIRASAPERVNKGDKAKNKNTHSLTL